MGYGDLPAGVGARRDYSEEGRALIARLGLQPSGGGYNEKDLLWRDEATGGCVYVGNHRAARSAGSTEGLTHVLNCTDDLPNYCEATSPGLRYMRFNVAMWQAAGDMSRGRPASKAEIGQWLQSMFAFVDDALQSGGSVLVHCLAGAHRAGTTGVLLLMYKAQLDPPSAIAAAKALRPAIDPIGGLPGVLACFEALRKDEQEQRKPASSQ